MVQYRHTIIPTYTYIEYDWQGHIKNKFDDPTQAAVATKWKEYVDKNSIPYVRLVAIGAAGTTILVELVDKDNVAEPVIKTMKVIKDDTAPGGVRFEE